MNDEMLAWQLGVDLGRAGGHPIAFVCRKDLLPPWVCKLRFRMGGDDFAWWVRQGFADAEAAAR